MAYGFISERRLAPARLIADPPSGAKMIHPCIRNKTSQERAAGQSQDEHEGEEEIPVDHTPADRPHIPANAGPVGHIDRRREARTAWEEIHTAGPFLRGGGSPSTSSRRQAAGSRASATRAPPMPPPPFPAPLCCWAAVQLGREVASPPALGCRVSIAVRPLPRAPAMQVADYAVRGGSSMTIPEALKAVVRRHGPI